ncbi:zinc knuckle [Colletotrichum orchidophilum]|uniref:Zinc knuckle n=1 Tax=Colletotrichum orchidophilum TaxID=1209926 RepID=A0A1G4B0D0_9PEZI|nr:zinc knuckle [Colletotrichum orchidophilum]OHE94826.1 zinc knuckle [Colletotrichum orchidophilum]
MLRKLSKDNYIILKLHRPIVFLNTVRKIINVIITERLSYITETYKLLLKNYISKKK